MKALTKKQIENLRNIVINNNNLIGASVSNITKNKYSMVVEMLVHTLTETNSMFITLDLGYNIISVNGNRSLAFNYCSKTV